jgi:glucose/arabinose dehydrogenase
MAGSKVVSEEMLLKGIGRVRNVKQGPDGYIYVAVEEPGRIYKIIPVK